MANIVKNYADSDTQATWIQIKTVTDDLKKQIEVQED